MIAVRNLTKNHGPLRVLDGATLTVQPGQVAVIVGPSGGGKSTLLRCVNGLERFQGGEVEVGEGQGRLTLTPARARPAFLRQLRERVGMVFQQFHLFPHLTALENVLSGPLWAQGRPRREAEPEALALLERVGLAEKRDARPDQLSGGQQQRVAIARALAVKPAAVLFDEPTSALDPQMAREVLEVIDRLGDGGQTMVVVTHDMAFTRRVADVVFVMHAGRVAESGPPERVFEQPEHQATRAFFAAEG